MNERAGEVLVLRDVRRTFEQGGQALEVLKGVSFSLRPGEIVALTGPSGSGKSTLLQIAGLLERPSVGEVIIDGASGGQLGDRRRTQIRREKLGFVYQYHHLLREFSALENVVLPQMIAGVSKRKARERARALLASLGLSAREGHRPARLSGGEQQRVAIARALANRPVLLLADEPTGNLDHATAEAVFAGLVDVVRQTSSAALIATHNTELAGRMDRRLALEDGRVVEH
ncbi:MAG: ABC transporter ATP-binding protein [Alphaproteobacteria bacterium]